MQYYYIGSGTGTGTEKLNSFDNALIEAGVGNYNLVRVSSILPTEGIRKESIDVKEGEPLHVAYASITSNVIGSVVSAAVAVGIPKNSSKIGVIMEYEGQCSKEEAEHKVISMVREAMECHHIELKNIEMMSSECYISEEKYYTSFAVVALW